MDRGERWDAKRVRGDSRCIGKTAISHRQQEYPLCLKRKLRERVSFEKRKKSPTRRLRNITKKIFRKWLEHSGF